MPSFFARWSRADCCDGGRFDPRLVDGTGDATCVLPTGDASVSSLAVSDDVRRLATVADKGSVKLWQCEE